MKILCVNYEYPPIGGGGGAACKDLAERLIHFGHSVDVVTSALKGLPQIEDAAGVHLERVPCLRRFRHYVTTPEMLTQVLPTYRRARQLVAREDYALNHTHFIVPSGLASYLLWSRTGLPYVITAHGSDVPGYNPDRFSITHRLIRPLWRKIIHRAAAIVTPSHFLKRLMQEQVDVEPEVIPNGIDFPSGNGHLKQDRILVVTRMFERKGVQYLIEAVRDMQTDWEIVIAGDGPYMGTLKELAKNSRNKIEFTGFVRGKQLTDLYHSAKVFVFPSTQENFPIVLLEAMNAGCAVVTTSASGCAEVVGNSAVKVAPANVPDLRQALEHLTRNESEVLRLSQAGRQRATQFTSASVARQYERLFERLALPARQKVA